MIQASNPYLTIEEVYDIVELGVVDIYDIPGNDEYEEKLGSGRFDAWETWLNVPSPAGVVETIDPKMEMTMHLRSPDLQSPLKLKATLFYRQPESEEEDGGGAEGPPLKPEIMVVDQAETTFELP